MTNSSFPVLQLRLRAPDTASDAEWSRTLKIIADNPGCCDEVWFSTGIGIPPLSVHEERARRVTRAAADLRNLGIVPSLQFQATIGHSDMLSATEDCSAKSWTGWTGTTGVECKVCNCPRQPGFLEYVRSVSKLYAAFKPSSVWIDDDLRYDNHRPATEGSRPGCWCQRCISDFNSATGGGWTRETLSAAIKDDSQLHAEWIHFTNGSLAEVARVIAKEFAKVSPDTVMALQHGMAAFGTIGSVLQTLRQASGHSVGMRPGGGAYYDIDPNSQVLTSLEAARFRRNFGDPDWISVWTPEVESWPRMYGSRSAQSILVQGFTALMYGMNAVSMLVIQTGNEAPELYSETILRPLADGAPVLRGYAETCAETIPTGFASDADVPSLYKYAATAIPVLFGVGRASGELTEEDLALNRCLASSVTIQRARDALDQRAGGTPAVVCSPFVGLMLPRVSAKDGALCSVALLNVRIDVQGPIELRLRGVPKTADKAVWHELRKPPVEIPLRRSFGCAYATIPQIGAWNAGWLEL